MKVICSVCHEKTDFNFQNCQYCLSNLHPYSGPAIISTPSWASESKRVMGDGSHSDPKREMRATDAWEETRAKEMKNSPKWRRWEEQRKKEFYDNKKYWKKDQEHKKDMEMAQVVREVSNKYGR